MTTITKERLLTIKQWRETYGPGSNVVLPAEEAEELARIALASLEADPVKRVNSDQMRRVCLEANRHLDKYDAMAKEVNKLLGRIAPPAPVVPEEATPENVEMLSGYVSTYKLTDSERDIAAEIWNACRAAMLQSGNFRENKDSSTNNFRKIPEASTSSPVTPDGWISCSARMPAQDDWILIYSKHGEYMAGQVQGEYVELSDGTLSWLGNALFWMPLPEPPKEVRQ
ncbi:DUF551 domain-containing protein [Escherichia coli]